MLAEFGALDVGDEGIEPIVVETQAVDQGLGFGQAEHARFGIARLRFGGDSAHFNKAETHRTQAIDTTGVFVQTGGHAYAVGKV